ncbi:MAG: hypothetical protein FWE91_10565 [Defluviitaleaceae bacterium]|nr:hypothetical protein [Defluviitaleaceae bacterium]MCL2835223.1 hypothetical protein [Defluviitaleaceae bacterium]
MLLFTLSLIGLILSIFALLGTVALWVYKDAKTRAENAGIWAILSLVAFPVGLIVYLLAGRTKKVNGTPAPKIKLIILAIFFAVLVAVSAGLLIYSVTGGSLTGFGSVKSGAFSMSMNWYSDGRWSFNARSANGRISRSPNLTAEELNSFFVTNSNNNGEVSLLISQGNVETTVDISGYFNGYIDMSDFKPGRIRLQLNFNRASDVSALIRWR